jgi:hypothetical protein
MWFLNAQNKEVFFPYILSLQRRRISFSVAHEQNLCRIYYLQESYTSKVQVEHGNLFAVSFGGATAQQGR